MKATINRLSSILNRIMSVATDVIITALCLLIFAAVIARFIFNSPIAWQYEATLVALSWVVFLGMSMTFYTEEHLRLTFVTNALKPKAYVRWMFAIDLFCIIFLIIGIVCSISVIDSTWEIYYKTIPIRKGIFYLPFPIGCAISIIHLVNHMLTRKPNSQKSSDMNVINSQEV